jgi:hypothetical protein
LQAEGVSATKVASVMLDIAIRTLDYKTLAAFNEHKTDLTRPLQQVALENDEEEKREDLT